MNGLGKWIITQDFAQYKSLGVSFSSLNRSLHCCRWFFIYLFFLSEAHLDTCWMICSLRCLNPLDKEGGNTWLSTVWLNWDISHWGNFCYKAQHFELSDDVHNGLDIPAVIHIWWTDHTNSPLSCHVNQSYLSHALHFLLVNLRMCTLVVLWDIIPIYLLHCVFACSCCFFLPSNLQLLWEGIGV